MTTHIYGSVLTHQGIFSNNRGESEGTTATLQKVFRDGEMHTTVSAEAIRFALRQHWQDLGKWRGREVLLNRKSTELGKTKYHNISFDNWHEHVDDDLLGFMRAHRTKEKNVMRRAPLEVARALSITPWLGDAPVNFGTGGSNPGNDYQDNMKLKADAYDGGNPYYAEVHDTRYVIDFGLTVDAIGRDQPMGEPAASPTTHHNQEEVLWRTELALNGMISLRRVGGAHARYFADYSAAAVILRVTDDPAPRFMRCYKQKEHGADIRVASLLASMKKESEDFDPDILPTELVVGAADGVLAEEDMAALEKMGVSMHNGVKAAVGKAMEKARSCLEQRR